MTQNKETLRAAEEQDVARNYQPVALRAVLAAALMLKRPAAAKAKKAA